MNYLKSLKNHWGCFKYDFFSNFLHDIRRKSLKHLSYKNESVERKYLNSVQRNNFCSYRISFLN